MSEALAKVKKELGPDAVILHTRTVSRGGVLGVGARPIVEITATADGRAAALRRPPANASRIETSDEPAEDAGLTRSVAMAQAAVKAYQNGGGGNDHAPKPAAPPGKPLVLPATRASVQKQVPADRLQLRKDVAPPPRV